MSGPQQQRDNATAERGDDLVSHAVQELLNSIRRGAPKQEPATGADVNLERVAADYAAVVLRGQVESQRVQMSGRGGPGPALPGGLGPVLGDLRRMVQQVRAHYMALADIEIRRMLDEVLLGEPLEMPSLPQPELGARETSNVPSDEGQEEWAADDIEVTVDSENAGPEKEAAPVEDGPADDAKAERVEKGARGNRNEDLYEGTVRLIVMAGGNMQKVVRFVDELCQRPQFRMLRMAGSPQQEGAEISIGLREPLPFETVLSEMDNVVRVESERTGKGGSERTVTVHLATDAA